MTMYKSETLINTCILLVFASLVDVEGKMFFLSKTYYNKSCRRTACSTASDLCQT